MAKTGTDPKRMRFLARTPHSSHHAAFDSVASPPLNILLSPFQVEAPPTPNRPRVVRYSHAGSNQAVHQQHGSQHRRMTPQAEVEKIANARRVGDRLCQRSKTPLPRLHPTSGKNSEYPSSTMITALSHFGQNEPSRAISLPLASAVQSIESAAQAIGMPFQLELATG